MALTPEQNKQGRRYFRVFNRFMVYMWRIGLGPVINGWPEVGGQIMVLTHTGRKSGLKRRTPVNYVLDNGDLYCAAGFGPGSDWYQNILMNPQVEVWLPDSWWAGLAEEVLDAEKRLPLLRKIFKASGAAALAAGVNIDQMADEELVRISENYRVLRIHRTTARTGPGGPGDLAWVWQVATFVLLWKLMFRKKRRK